MPPRRGVVEGHMPLMLCTVREALVIREGARHRVSRGKEVSAAWQGRKKRKKRCWLGWPACVIPTKDTLKGEEVTQSESPEIGSFYAKICRIRVPPFWTREISFSFLKVLFSSIITFFFLPWDFIFYFSSFHSIFFFFCRRALFRFGFFFFFFSVDPSNQKRFCAFHRFPSSIPSPPPTHQAQKIILALGRKKFTATPGLPR